MHDIRDRNPESVHTLQWSLLQSDNKDKRSFWMLLSRSDTPASTAQPPTAGRMRRRMATSARIAFQDTSLSPGPFERAPPNEIIMHGMAAAPTRLHSKSYRVACTHAPSASIFAAEDAMFPLTEILLLKV
jgi:hypothetical protein